MKIFNKNVCYPSPNSWQCSRSSSWPQSRKILDARKFCIDQKIILQVTAEIWIWIVHKWSGFWMGSDIQKPFHWKFRPFANQTYFCPFEIQMHPDFKWWKRSLVCKWSNRNLLLVHQYLTTFQLLDFLSAIQVTVQLTDHWAIWYIFTIGILGVSGNQMPTVYELVYLDGDQNHTIVTSQCVQ